MSEARGETYEGDVCGKCSSRTRYISSGKCRACHRALERERWQRSHPERPRRPGRTLPGQPCKVVAAHVDERGQTPRYVVTGKCVECERAKARASYERRKGRAGERAGGSA